MSGADLWSLPAAQQFLAEVEPMVWRGGAVITLDASTPPNLAERLVLHLRDDVALINLSPSPGSLPLAVLSEACGLANPSIVQILQTGRSFIVEASCMSAPDLARWGHTLCEFATHFPQYQNAGALFFLGAAKVPGFGRLDWSNRLRRVDAMIWAEYAVPSGRAELMQRLAVEVAVELCGWRLDLVADLVSQREEDILDPMGWMQRHADEANPSTPSFGASQFSCPLHLISTGGVVEVRRRIWSAQLSVLFPWIEAHRQRLIERYHNHLYIDEHLSALGVLSIDDIELGGLRWQLGRVLAREEVEKITALANLRNDLAHRKPVRVADFVTAHRMSRE
jgi:hypothetical protein